MRSFVSDRHKYRIIGIIAALSLALVLLPAVMKKPNDHLDRQINLAIQLPEKPRPIQVKAPEKKVFFEMAQDLPDDVLETGSHLARMPQRVSAKPVQVVVAQRTQAIKLAKAEASRSTISLKQQNTPSTNAEQIIAHPSKQLSYGVQLGTFSDENNAEALVKQLKTKGYTAYYQTLEGKNGVLYKVVVGQLKQKNEAKHLQRKLTESTKMHGFVIQTGVS